jgi:Zn finger protein HypA/HybF involved in hydrogenase expression
MSYNSDIPCPECGEKELEIHTTKALSEALANIIVTADKVKNSILEGKHGSELEDLVQSMECKNCGNKESKFDNSVIERGFEAAREDS